jgi:hypothetical protein
LIIEKTREIERETYLPKGLRREKGAINEGTNEEKRNKVCVIQTKRTTYEFQDLRHCLSAPNIILVLCFLHYWYCCC